VPGSGDHLFEPWPGDVVLVSQSYHLVPVGLQVTDALDLMVCIVVPAGTGQSELQIKLLNDLQATAMFGFPSRVTMPPFSTCKDTPLSTRITPYVWHG
jgi:hypothetical protein